MELPIKTYQDVMDINPCYDPVERGYCTKDWAGTALDVLRAEHIPPEDRLYVVINDGWIPERTLHEFAIWCAEDALKRVGNPDPRSLNALEVKRRWLDGKATDEELAAAWDAAWDAAGDAARAAARDAAMDAAWDAARAAALAAARAAMDAARAAMDAARAAAWAAMDAARAAMDAGDAARAAARAAIAAARAAQVARLIEMLESE
jgi:hypothetical protein